MSLFSLSLTLLPSEAKTLSFLSVFSTRKSRSMAKTKTRSHWLLKSEPGEWSWEDQRANGGISQWDGVRNRQAINHLKSMRPGDLSFFYHSGSGTSARQIIGVVQVIKPWYLIGDDELIGAVDVKEIGEMKHHVELKEIKKEAQKEKELKNFALLRQSRLSVVPVSDSIWERLCQMGSGYDNGDNSHCDDNIVEEEMEGKIGSSRQ